MEIVLFPSNELTQQETLDWLQHHFKEINWELKIQKVAKYPAYTRLQYEFAKAFWPLCFHENIKLKEQILSEEETNRACYWFKKLVLDKEKYQVSYIVILTVFLYMLKVMNILIKIRQKM